MKLTMETLFSDGFYIFVATSQREINAYVNMGYHKATEDEINEWLEDDNPPIIMH